MLPALNKMKRFLFIVVSTAALVSCGKKEEASSIVIAVKRITTGGHVNASVFIGNKEVFGFDVVFD